MKNIFILILLFFITTNSHLIIPLKYYPLYKYNYTNPSEIMKTIVASKIYAKIEIGTPKKQIELPLDFSSNDFYISDNPKTQFEDNNLFSDLKFYLNNESSSFITDGDVQFSGENFDFAEVCTESFFFNNSKYELIFHFPFLLNNPESGGIGLLLQSKSDATPNPEKTFFKQIKDKKLINNYVWSIFFNTKNITNEAEGFLLLGSLPHELETNLGYYDKKNFQKILKNVNAEISDVYVLNKFKIDEFSVYEGNNKNKIIDDFLINDINLKYIELDYHSNGIQAPDILLEKYQKIFEDYSNGECFMDTFTYVRKKKFFYCKNNKEVIKKIKSVFPGFNFLSRDLDFNFTIDADDLFLEKDDYVFCLLYFYPDIYENNWIMGKPFLSKYQFSFNPDIKQIYFYSQEIEEDSKGAKISPTVLIIAIVATIIIVAVICFLLFKYYLYDLFIRKKRANELVDDFDYIEKKEEDNDNQNQQNNPKANIEIN